MAGIFENSRIRPIAQDSVPCGILSKKISSLINLSLGHVIQKCIEVSFSVYRVGLSGCLVHIDGISSNNL